MCMEPSKSDHIISCKSSSLQLKDSWGSNANDMTDDEQEDLPYDGILECYLIPNSLHNKVNDACEDSDCSQSLTNTKGEKEDQCDTQTVSVQDESLFSLVNSDEFSFSETVSKCRSESEENAEVCLSNKSDNKSLAFPSTIIPDVLLRHFNDDNLLNPCHFIDHETIPEISVAESIDETVINRTHIKYSQDDSETEQEDDLQNDFLERHSEEKLNDQGENKVTERNSNIDDAACKVTDGEMSLEPILDKTEVRNLLPEYKNSQDNKYHQERKSSHDIKYGQGQVHYKLPDFSKVPSKVKIPKGNNSIRPVDAMERARPSPCLMGSSFLIREILDSMQPFVGPGQMDETSETSECLHVQVSQVSVYFPDSSKKANYVPSSVTTCFSQNSLQPSSLQPDQTEKVPQAIVAGNTFQTPSSTFTEERMDIASSHIPTEGEKMSEMLREQSQHLKTKVDHFSECLIKESLPLKEQHLVFESLKSSLECLERNYLSTKERHRDLQLQVYRTGSQTVGDFDMEREVEGQIFKLGMQLDDIKEQINNRGDTLSSSITIPITPCDAAPYLHCETEDVGYLQVTENAETGLNGESLEPETSSALSVTHNNNDICSLPVAEEIEIGLIGESLEQETNSNLPVAKEVDIGLIGASLEQEPSTNLLVPQDTDIGLIGVSLEQITCSKLQAIQNTQTGLTGRTQETISNLRQDTKNVLTSGSIANKTSNILLLPQNTDIGLTGESLEHKTSSNLSVILTTEIGLTGTNLEHKTLCNLPKKNNTEIDLICASLEHKPSNYLPATQHTELGQIGRNLEHNTLCNLPEIHNTEINLIGASIECKTSNYLPVTQHTELGQIGKSLEHKTSNYLPATQHTELGQIGKSLEHKTSNYLPVTQHTELGQIGKSLEHKTSNYLPATQHTELGHIGTSLEHKTLCNLPEIYNTEIDLTGASIEHKTSNNLPATQHTELGQTGISLEEKTSSSLSCSKSLNRATSSQRQTHVRNKAHVKETADYSHLMQTQHCPETYHKIRNLRASTQDHQVKNQEVTQRCQNVKTQNRRRRISGNGNLTILIDDKAMNLDLPDYNETEDSVASDWVVTSHSEVSTYKSQSPRAKRTDLSKELNYRLKEIQLECSSDLALSRMLSRHSRTTKLHKSKSSWGSRAPVYTQRRSNFSTNLNYTEQKTISRNLLTDRHNAQLPLCWYPESASRISTSLHQLYRGRRSLPCVEQNYLDSIDRRILHLALDKALHTARNMQRTTERMIETLAADLVMVQSYHKSR